MILNTHSTLVMGRLGSYEGNIMTYVRASNNKLIDRAIRYIDLILRNKNITLSYEELAHILFEMIEKTPVDHAIVLATVAEIERQTGIEKGTRTNVSLKHGKCSSFERSVRFRVPLPYPFRCRCFFLIPEAQDHSGRSR